MNKMLNILSAICLIVGFIVTAMGYFGLLTGRLEKYNINSGLIVILFGLVLYIIIELDEK